MKRTGMILMCVWILASCGPVTQQDKTSAALDAVAVEVVSHKMTKNTGEYCFTLVEVRNGGEDLKAVEVVVDLYDGSGQTVGTGFGHVKDFVAGSVRTVEVASDYQGDVDNYVVRTGTVYRY